MSTPSKYDMTKPDDIRRWFREMGGYLRNFTEQGTDKEGRILALDGFRQLRMQFAEKMGETDQ